MKSPHQRIVEAARKGKGVRLSATETSELAGDDAVQRCAGNDDEADDRFTKAVKWWNERIPYITERIKEDKDKDSMFKWKQLVWQEIRMYCRIGRVDRIELSDLCDRRGFNNVQRAFLEEALKHVELI